MKLTVNGEQREVPDGLDARGLLNELGLKEKLVVVELNREIIKREAIDGTPLNDGDVVEIMRYIGGG